MKRWVVVGAVLPIVLGVAVMTLGVLVFPAAADVFLPSLLQVVLVLGSAGALAGLCVGGVDHVLERYVERRSPDGRAVWVATVGLFAAVVVALRVGPWYTPGLVTTMVWAAVPAFLASRRYRRLSIGGAGAMGREPVG